MSELPKLFVSVSGGRTSAYMAWWLRENWSGRFDIKFGFANTSAEHSDTYRFVEDVNRNLLGGELVYLEGVVHQDERKATTHRIVSHNELTRDGEVFDAICAKYGIPNQKFPHCTREMKANVMRSYCRSLWSNDYSVAIGLRIDEERRADEDSLNVPVFYPLIDAHPTTKEEIIEWFQPLPWDLRIPEYLGNCVTCWKKSEAKLNAVWWDDPSHFDLFKLLEAKHGHIRSERTDDPSQRFTFFRGGQSAAGLCSNFAYLNNDNRHRWKRDEEDQGVCSESCEPFPMVLRPRRRIQSDLFDLETP